MNVRTYDRLRIYIYLYTYIYVCMYGYGMCERVPAGKMQSFQVNFVGV